MSPCAYCGKPAEHRHTIHRDGFCVGPEVPLCDACGSRETPTCEDIWSRIAKPADGQYAYRRRDNARDIRSAGRRGGR